MKTQKKFYTELLRLLPQYPKKESNELFSALITCLNIAFIVGNGGSAAIASHVAEDFTKIAGVRMKTYNDTALISCFANDYGWENWIAKAIELYKEQHTVGIFISSSGTSQNIINGCKQANKQGLFTVTLSGFNADNSLRKLGNINYWVPSNTYNVVELVHEAWLLSICDQIASKWEQI